MRRARVQARNVGTIPLPEVSGLARGLDGTGRPVLVAIGDRAATIAWAVLDRGVDALEWQTLDLRHAEGTRFPEQDPQLEAVAVDGQMGVVLVAESPNRAEAIDARTRRVRAHVTFEIPEARALADLRDSWHDPDCSHTEGVVLMRRGHVLLVKEKDPVALLEFGPAGDEPLGLRPEAWLSGEEGWGIGEGEVVLTCLAAWRPSEELLSASPDLSDAEVGLDGRLLLTGDQAGVLVAVAGHEPGEDPLDGRFDAQAVWRVDGIEAKPEGVAVLPGGDVLIACDRRKVKRNLFLVSGEQLR